MRGVRRSPGLRRWKDRTDKSSGQRASRKSWRDRACSEQSYRECDQVRSGWHLLTQTHQWLKRAVWKHADTLTLEKWEILLKPGELRVANEVFFYTHIHVLKYTLCYWILLNLNCTQLENSSDFNMVTDGEDRDTSGPHFHILGPFTSSNLWKILWFA